MVINGDYKYTEIGIIPKDWDCIHLCSLGQLLSGLTYTPEDVRDYGLLVLRSSNIQEGRLSFKDNVYVNCKIEDDKYVKQGDLLICVRNGSRALIGKCALIDRNYNATFGAFMALFRSQHGKYLYQLFSNNVIQEQINRNCGATINQITSADFNRFLIAFPRNPKEQAAISEALSDVDNLISSLQKLVEKRKAIKQGAMQELLAGKKRLPGFSGEWSQFRLGEMTEIYSGGTPSTTISEYWGGSIPWMSSGELNNKKIYDVEGRITQKGMQNSSAHLIPKYCVLIGLAGQGKTRGTAAYNYISLCTNQSIAAIYPNDKKFDSLFLYYIIDSMYESLRELSSGDGGRGGLTKGLISNLEIYMPEVPEQRAIAQVLSDMDSEIELLEKKLAKYQQIKQGMMQELLTGRIRLV